MAKQILTTLSAFEKSMETQVQNWALLILSKKLENVSLTAKSASDSLPDQMNG